MGLCNMSIIQISFQFSELNRIKQIIVYNHEHFSKMVNSVRQHKSFLRSENAISLDLFISIRAGRRPEGVTFTDSKLQSNVSLHSKT